jgi:isomerase DpgB
MVTDRALTGRTAPPDAGQARAGELVIGIDGRQHLSAELVMAIGTICDRAEDRGDHCAVIVHVSGAPVTLRGHDPGVALVSRWERGLRRLERLPAATIAVATGDCGGLALDALLACDYRIADVSVRLLVPVQAGATWPGMALYRLAQQASITAVRRAVLLGVPIGVSQALTLQLIDELTDDVPGAEAAAAALAAAFSGPELAIRRQLMLDASTVTFEEALGRHLAACDRELRRLSARQPS